MNKTTTPILVFILTIIIGAGLVYAATQWAYPQSATVPPERYRYYVDDEAWSNGTNIDWYDLYPGTTNYCNFTVVSLVPSNTTITIYPLNLPIGWTQTWTANNTLIPPLGTAFGWLNVTVPSDAVAGDYSWSLIVKGEYT
jgi:hypothetical protein